MLKVVFSVMMILSSLFAGVVGSKGDGILENKAYIDIYLDDSEIIYQYVTYSNGFDLSSRSNEKLNKYFAEWDKRRSIKRKIVISGNIALPNNVKDKVAIVLSNKPFACNKGEEVNNFKNSEKNFYGGDDSWGYGLYMNGKFVSTYRTIQEVHTDKFGNKYIPFKIVAFASEYYHSDWKDVIARWAKVKMGLTKYLFNVEGKQKRGQDRPLIPLSVYCIEE